MLANPKVPKVKIRVTATTGANIRAAGRSAVLKMMTKGPRERIKPDDIEYRSMKQTLNFTCKVGHYFAPPVYTVYDGMMYGQLTRNGLIKLCMYRTSLPAFIVCHM